MYYIWHTINYNNIIIDKDEKLTKHNINGKKILNPYH